MNVFFKALVMVATCTPFVGMHAMHNVPQLIKGSIYLHNTLDEKIDYQMKATITGDSEQGYFFENCTMQNSGEIAAHTTIKLFSGLVIDDKDIWSSPVELTLQPQSMARPTRITLMEDIIGLYYIGKKKITFGTDIIECLTLTKKAANDNDDIKTNGQSPISSGASY